MTREEDVTKLQLLRDLQHLQGRVSDLERAVQTGKGFLLLGGSKPAQPDGDVGEVVARAVGATVGEARRKLDKLRLIDDVKALCGIVQIQWSRGADARGYADQIMSVLNESEDTTPVGASAACPESCECDSICRLPAVNAPSLPAKVDENGNIDIDGHVYGVSISSMRPSVKMALVNDINQLNQRKAFWVKQGVRQALKPILDQMRAEDSMSLAEYADRIERATNSNFFD